MSILKRVFKDTYVGRHVIAVIIINLLLSQTITDIKKFIKSNKKQFNIYKS